MKDVTLLYLLSKRQISTYSMKRIPVFVMGLMLFIVFVFVMTLRASAETSYLYGEQSNLIIWVSIGLLFITVAIFLMHELFVKEEIKNANLALNLQRLEMENEHFHEINSIYEDIRAWRHEYNNNLIVLRDLTRQGNKERILSYIDNISNEPLQFESTLQTGNFILDSIVSAKLGLAQKRGIEVSIQAVYPRKHRINDNDLCTIVGNLLDNAIEACGFPSKAPKQNSNEILEQAQDREQEEAIKEKFERRYIDFEFLAKGKNIVISVQNSYFHEVKMSNERFVSRKDGKFHGIGLSLLDSVVHKYNGHIMRNHENGVFKTYVILPLVTSDEVI